jgi:hypothetical protein
MSKTATKETPINQEAKSTKPLDVKNLCLKFFIKTSDILEIKGGTKEVALILTQTEAKTLLSAISGAGIVALESKHFEMMEIFLTLFDKIKNQLEGLS